MDKNWKQICYEVLFWCKKDLASPHLINVTTAWFFCLQSMLGILKSGRWGGDYTTLIGHHEGKHGHPQTPALMLKVGGRLPPLVEGAAAGWPVPSTLASNGWPAPSGRPRLLLSAVWLSSSPVKHRYWLLQSAFPQSKLLKNKVDSLLTCRTLCPQPSACLSFCAHTWHFTTLSHARLLSGFTQCFSQTERHTNFLTRLSVPILKACCKYKEQCSI